jgi:ribosomal protein L14
VSSDAPGKAAVALTLPGDEIVCVINKARPIASTSNAPAAGNIQKVRRGDIRRAVVVRTRKWELRPDGRYVGCAFSQQQCRGIPANYRSRFDDSACVLLNNKSEMVGTRVNGVVSSALRDVPGGAGGPGGKWSKILALATKVSPFCLSGEIGLMRSQVV